MHRYRPGSSSNSVACSAGSSQTSVASVRQPPEGIASRALIARFSSAFSSCEGSQCTALAAFSRVSTRIFGPTVRRTSSSSSAMIWLGSTRFGSSGCCREKVSSRLVSAAARLTDDSASEQ